MIARAVNQAADVIHRAQVNGAQTATGLAMALDSAQLLQSPEAVHAAAQVEAQRDALLARVAELEAAAYGDATVRLLDPVGQIRHLHAAVAAQMARADTLDRLCREQRARADRLALREVSDGEHYAAVHHDYRTPHDLPELGGAR